MNLRDGQTVTIDGLLDQQGRNARSPSLFDRDAYQFFLREHATNVTGIADGIKDVLTTALTETGCFSVQDRDQMDEIAEELARAGKSVQIEQAEFLISGAVTEIDVSVQNKSFGAGLIPIIGSVGHKKQSASVSLDMKLVSVNSAKVVASKRATASTETSSTSFGAGGMGSVYRARDERPPAPTAMRPAMRVARHCDRRGTGWRFHHRIRRHPACRDHLQRRLGDDHLRRPDRREHHFGRRNLGHRQRQRGAKRTASSSSTRRVRPRR